MPKIDLSRLPVPILHAYEQVFRAIEYHVDGGIKCCCIGLSVRHMIELVAVHMSEKDMTAEEWICYDCKQKFDGQETRWNSPEHGGICNACYDKRYAHPVEASDG